MKEKLASFFKSDKCIFICFLLITLGVCAQQVIWGLGNPEKPNDYTLINNYLIFKNSFKHLLDNLNLYTTYPNEYYDLYKYSPTFAVFMSPFNLLPVGLGVCIWTLINSFSVFYTVKKLPVDASVKNYLLFFILIELTTSLQNEQSNAILLALCISLCHEFQEH